MIFRLQCRLSGWGCLAAWFVVVSSAWGANGPYGVHLETEVMVPMRDGVKLAADLYLPTKNGQPIAEKVPAILARTPYGTKWLKREGEYFASHGYAFIGQDTRGRFKSEGTWHWLSDDGPDGYDTCEWIGKQPWFSGKIGTIGTSYLGGTQHAMAMEKAPHLATMIPVDAVSNMGYASVRNGGAFELRFWNWIMNLGGSRATGAKLDPATLAVMQKMADDKLKYLAQLPLRRGTTPLKLAPAYENWLVDAMCHGANDDFWKQNNIIDYGDRYKDIPVYLVGGWYDSWTGNTATNYRVLSKRLKSPVYLIMGPWIHDAQGASSHGQVSFGEQAAIPDPLAWRKEWLDHWLKGIDNTVGHEAPFASRVRIFVMGTGNGRKTDKGRLNHGGYWRDEPDWPLSRAVDTRFFVHAGGGLSTQQPTGPRSSTSFVFDPKHPVPTIGGNISSADGLMQMGAWDQRGGKHIWNFPEEIPLSTRNDVLVFQTEPLAEDVEVTGEIVVKLWISSSAVDTDFTAKLIDVYSPSPDFPGGFDLNIGDGILRTRFRESLKQERMMEPGKIYPITVKLYPTSNVFKRGHRIRLDLSSSNFPRFDVNPNTGEPLNDHRRTVTATNTIHHDSEHPSHIVLSVVAKAIADQNKP